MKISEFLALEGKLQISPEAAQKLNQNLSEVSAIDIPKEKINQVLDYLVAALNIESVDLHIETKLDKLVSDLQEIR